MILYIENPKDATRKLLELINEIGKVAGYKINAQNSLAFLGFPGGTMVKNLPANAGDMGSSPGQEDPTCRGTNKPMCHNY